MIIIAGAGVTGLWLAKKLGHLNPLVISQNVGGLLGQYGEGGFKFDYGGHVYTTLDARVNTIMKRAFSIEHERNAHYIGDQLQRVPYPVQDHAQKLDITLREHFKEPIENLRDWALNKFGFSFYEKWYQPFNARVWTVDPIEMDIDWVRDRVKEETISIPGEWGPNATFQYAPGKTIAGIMKRDAEEAGARFLNATIHDVILSHKTVRLTETANPDSYKYDQLYWTLPINELSEQVGFSYNSFRNNRVMSFGIGLKSALDMEPFHWAYCNLDSMFHRVTWLSRYYPTLSPNSQDSLLVELPYRNKLAPWIPRIHRTGPEKIHRSLAQQVLKEAGFGIVQEKDIEVCMRGDIKGYPIPTVGIRNIVAETKRRLLEYGVRTAGRWGSWGYFNINHCFDDAEAAINIGEPGNTLNEYLHSMHYYGDK